MSGQIKADLNGDGNLEILSIGSDLAGSVATQVRDQNNILIWSHSGWIDGWNRRVTDSLVVAGDYDGDHADEVVIYNYDDNYTGIFKWLQGNLHCPWASPSPIDGWNRSPNDYLATAKLDAGQASILAYNNSDCWTGVFRWSNGGLHVEWASPGPIDGWHRHGEDQFVVVDIDGDGFDEVVIADAKDGWLGVLKWQNSALHVIWASPSPFKGPAGQCSLQGGGIASERSNSHFVIYMYDENGFAKANLQWQNNGLAVVAVF